MEIDHGMEEEMERWQTRSIASGEEGDRRSGLEGEKWRSGVEEVRFMEGGGREVHVGDFL